MLIINILHLSVNVEGKIDVMSQNIFSFGYIHITKLSNISLKFINRLWCILFFHNILNLLYFLTKCAFKGVKMFISNILEYLIIICQSQNLKWFHRWSFWIFLGIWFNNVCIYINAASLDSKYFI